MPELAEPRQQAILELLNDGGSAAVSSLAKRFEVSEMTIRRDLKTLEEQGLAVRVHGGALAAEKSRFSIRLSANARAKTKAVLKFADNLPHQGCIYFDGSTTVLNLARMLKGRTRLQVATNNVETFNTIAQLNGPAPILIGGTLDFRTDNLIGPLAIRSIEALAFEAAYFSAWGLSSELGLNEATVEDALVKGQVARRTQSVYVALDHSKFGVVAGGTWQHGSDKTVLATDLEPGDKRLAPYNHMFKEII